MFKAKTIFSIAGGALLLGSLSAVLSGCSPLYLLRGAYENSKILSQREKISSFILSDKATAEEKEKLKVVVQARKFALARGLTPGQSFTRYTRLDREALTWIVVASKKDAFQLATWWFPIVGRVPYKGYFDKEDALALAASFEQNGYETSVRGAEAFSSLGWFIDPVLTTTLRHDHVRIVATVIHESLHATIWIPGSVDFNESLANFVGAQGAIEFFAEQGNQDLEEKARASWELEKEFAQLLTRLYAELDVLYSSDVPADQKLLKRDEIFGGIATQSRSPFAFFASDRKVNNADIMQRKLYMTELPLFENLYNRCAHDWSCFLERVRTVTKDSNDPFAALRAELATEARHMAASKPVPSVGTSPNSQKARFSQSTDSKT